jgi:putative membrane protein
VTVSDLPALNAALNATATVLLLRGRWLIRRRRVAEHRRTMIGAVATSCAFLVSYVIYHARTGSRPFAGHGSIRTVYFVILTTHVILAAAIVPLVLLTLRRGLRRQDARHRALARWTWPLWLYVSVTGVVIYVMLYLLY